MRRGRGPHPPRRLHMLALMIGLGSIVADGCIQLLWNGRDSSPVRIRKQQAPAGTRAYGGRSEALRNLLFVMYGRSHTIALPIFSTTKLHPSGTGPQVPVHGSQVSRTAQSLLSWMLDWFRSATPSRWSAVDYRHMPWHSLLVLAIDHARRINTGPSCVIVPWA